MTRGEPREVVRSGTGTEYQNGERPKGYMRISHATIGIIVSVACAVGAGGWAIFGALRGTVRSLEQRIDQRADRLEKRIQASFARAMARHRDRVLNRSHPPADRRIERIERELYRSSRSKRRRR